MGSIAATKPEMGVLSQKRLVLSPFGALVRAFSEDLLARNGFEEGLWPFIPLEFPEEAETAPPRPVPPTVQMDLKLVLQALRQKESHTREERITERIVERIIRLQEGEGPRPDQSRSAARQPPAGPGQAETAQGASVKGQSMAGEALAQARTIHQISVLRQNFYDTVNQHAYFTSKLAQTVILSYPFQAREYVSPKPSASAENRIGGISAASAAPAVGMFFAASGEPLNRLKYAYPRANASQDEGERSREYFVYFKIPRQNTVEHLPSGRRQRFAQRFPDMPTAGIMTTLSAMAVAAIPELPGWGRKETGARLPVRRETQRRTLEELSHPDSGGGAAVAKEPGATASREFKENISDVLYTVHSPDSAVRLALRADPQTGPEPSAAVFQRKGRALEGVPGHLAASTAGKAGGRDTAEAHQKAEERRETHGPAGDVLRQTPTRQEGPIRRPRPETRPGWGQVSEPEIIAAGEPDGPDADHPSWRRQLHSQQIFGGMSLEKDLTIPSVQDIRITGAGQTGPEREENHAVTSDMAAAIPSTDSAELTYRTAPGRSEQPGTTPGLANTSSQNAPQIRAGAQNDPGTGNRTGVPESRSEMGSRMARARTADRADNKTSGSSMQPEALRLLAAPGGNTAGGGPVDRSAVGVSVGDTQNRQPERRGSLALPRGVSGAQWDGRHKEGSRAPGFTPAGGGAERRTFAAVPRDIRLFRTEPRAGTAQEPQITGNMVRGLSGEEIVYMTLDSAGDTAAGQPGQSAVQAARAAQAVKPENAAQPAQTARTERAALPPLTAAHMARKVNTTHTVGTDQSRFDMSGTIFSRPAQAGARDTLTQFRERLEGRAAQPPLPAGGARTGQTYGQPKGVSSDPKGAAAFDGSERVPLDLAGTVSGGQPDKASLGAISAGQFGRAPLSLAGTGPVGWTFTPELTDGLEAMPELAYAGRGQNAHHDVGMRPQEQQSRQGGTGSDDTRVLPDWARRFLLAGGVQGRTGASGNTGSAKSVAAPPVTTPREVISWTAPDYRPPSSIAFKERREPPQPPQNIRISDAEIRRTAEKVYRIIEERIRRERRRLGL